MNVCSRRARLCVKDLTYIISITPAQPGVHTWYHFQLTWEPSYFTLPD